MSELISKQEVLSEIAFAMVDDIPDVQALYDKIESMEPAQQTLNSNQQIVLDVLKKNANQGLDELIVGGITYMSDEEINAIELSQQEELFQVLAAFAEWGCNQ